MSLPFSFSNSKDVFTSLFFSPLSFFLFSFSLFFLYLYLFPPSLCTLYFLRSFLYSQVQPEITLKKSFVNFRLLHPFGSNIRIISFMSFLSFPPLFPPLISHELFAVHTSTSNKRTFPRSTHSKLQAIFLTSARKFPENL